MSIIGVSIDIANGNAIHAKGGISNTKMVNKEHVEGFLGRRKYSMAIKDY